MVMNREKEIMREKGKTKQFMKKKNKTLLLILSCFSLFTLIVLFLQLSSGNYRNVFFSLLTLLLLGLPLLLEYFLSLSFPTLLTILYFVFIFSVEILGKVFLFFMRLSYWDILLHILGGFICFGMGLYLLNLRRNKSTHIPTYMKILFSFSFAVTIGVFWEVCEFFGDQLFHLDNQNDVIINTISTMELSKEKQYPFYFPFIDHTNIYYHSHGKIKRKTIDGYLDIGLIDTMKDLMDNIFGAFLFSFLFILYIHNKKRYLFVEKLFLEK